MHAPTIATRAINDGICQDHQAAPEECGAQRDLAVYAALGTAAVVGAVVGGWYVAKWLRER